MCASSTDHTHTHALMNTKEASVAVVLFQSRLFYALIEPTSKNFSQGQMFIVSCNPPVSVLITFKQNP